MLESGLADAHHLHADAHLLSHTCGYRRKQSHSDSTYDNNGGSFISITAILTVANAKQFHTHALAEARRIERSRGHFQVLAAIPTSYATATAHGLSTTVRPIDYGADPTGKLDSTRGFERAMTALLKLSQTHSTMAAGIADLGGATLDLTGGKFLISRPLHIPPMFGNLHVRDGSLACLRGIPTSSTPHQHRQREQVQTIASKWETRSAR